MPPAVFTRLLMEINDSSPDDPPLFIGVTSMMTYWHQGVSETIKYIKQVFNDTPVILGGVYATLCYDHALKNSGADYVIKGPGEQAVLNITHKLGIISQSSKQQADQFPEYPSYHLYDHHQSISMLTSKGCPFHCSYCASASLSDTFSQKPPAEIVNEIKYYQDNLGATDIAFYDDALLLNAETHIHHILDGIIKLGLNKKIRFHTPNGLHIKYIDKPLAKKLYQANFKTIRLGFERLEDRKSSKNQLIQAVTNLKEAGFTAKNIGCYVLTGLPGQTMDEITRSIEFVYQCGALIRISQYSPVPGSPDFFKLLPDYPELAIEPLLHNKSVYYCHQKSGHFNDFEALKIKTLKLNRLLS